MSKIAISGAETGTGTFTLASPATNTDRTLDIPDASGTIDRLNRAGNVLQVVSTTKTDTFTTTSASFTDITGMSVSITPTSSNSKILVMYSLMTGETAGQFPMVRLVRDSTAIGVGTSVGSRTAATTSSWSNGAVNVSSVQSMQFLDSPATTGAVTYKLQIIGTASQVLYVNRNARDDNANYEPRTISTITVMEIAA